MPQPIQRVQTRIIDGRINHDDRPVSWDRVDELCGRRADRRRAWAIIDDEACILVKWTDLFWLRWRRVS